MRLKNKKAIIALITAAMASSAILPLAASAEVEMRPSERTKAEAFGDSTYKERFLSLYDDVVTNGVENGYLSPYNSVSGGFNVPYHSVEEVIVEAPDYGHETTSEAMSYIVWVAAMRDHLANDGQSDLTKAWKTLEVLVPKTQTGFMQGNPSASYSPEDSNPENYPFDMDLNNTGVNPIHTFFKSAYGSDSGLYLLHWLGDVDNWYGYGTGNSFTFINTFQRGENESCFETVPHPSIEELKYGTNRGLVGVFSTEVQPAAQWRYTNAPDAEDRAIQAVFAANRWGVGSADLSAKAGKMGDQCRNNMFDKYYKAISASTTSSSPTTGYDSAHYLMSWYTSWGGAMDGMWTWQIGASHCHQFYQNPLAAYALLNDSQLTAGMKAQGAVKDYETSLDRQLEFYEWLQSSTGPIAGGATNSWNGKYDPYPSGVSTFYEMAYDAHPVYKDPGSNHWIGNQTWAMQRLAELYLYAKEDGNTEIATRLQNILDKWVAWAVENTIFGEEAGDAGYAIPANLDWEGQPDTWTGTPSANTGLTCTIRNYTASDVGSVASWADTLIYYAKASGATAEDCSADSPSLGGRALYTAKKLMDCMWDYARDDIGVTIVSSNGSLVRIFEQDVWVPPAYGVGTMPNGDQIKNGIKFIDIRSMYWEEDKINELYADYQATGTTENTELIYHRFWHQGDILMALGALADLYPELTPETETAEEALVVDKTDIDLEVGETDTITSNIDDSTFTSDDTSVATVDENGTVTGVGAGETTITVTTPGGQTATVTVTVTEVTTTEETTTPDETTSSEDGEIDEDLVLYGDVDIDGDVDIFDVIALNKYLSGNQDLNATAKENANCADYDKHEINIMDSLAILKYVLNYDIILGPEV